ncbi:hypothetical protein LCGC14_1038550 [marine sediment metagenome]|uniref:Spore protein YkvP/CgeB glycosyl transferase-like domain-containing protein n=1 Tax=marine sediment metagenome TaxID=412755 RepID=A0A0F9QAP5_9ZZZZ
MFIILDNLLIFLNTKNKYLYPQYGKHEIYCGPKLQPENTEKRRVIQTSGTHFDIDKILSKLNEKDKKIDLIILSLETGTTCFPKNLYKIKCPKVAIITDTFHLMYPISPIINYLKQENIKHILCATQPAHLHFFYEAGIKHSALCPRSTLKFETKNNNRKPGVTYIGKKWNSSHPRRSRMIQFLEKELPKNNIPFHHYNRLPYLDWLKVLSHSKMIVVSSLNGQFTPQIYIILSAGALCFVDKLSSQTLLYQFFEPGKHLIVWNDFEDLLKKLIYYYNHPIEARTIAELGKYQVENNFTSTKSLVNMISDFVLKNKIDSRFLAINDKRCQQKQNESSKYFDARVRLYENIQELHLNHESLKLISLTTKNLNSSSDLADLPRLEITHAFYYSNLKNEADLYFQNVEVDHQIKTIMLDDIQDLFAYNIGILETQESCIDSSILIESISILLKKNSLLWVLGKPTSSEFIILKKEGFKPYKFKENLIKKISKKICLGFLKIGKYPFPYITLKPTMEMVSNLNVFIRGWQSKFPFLY